jgi:hypothetical protein
MFFGGDFTHAGIDRSFTPGTATGQYHLRALSCQILAGPGRNGLFSIGLAELRMS